jgi:anti-sigma factor RsiW
MQCCEDRIPALVDAATGELGGAARAELNEHLLHCPACRAELALLQGTTSLLEDTSRTPEDFSLAGFAARTTDRAVTFRDRSVKGLWWSVTRGVRLALSVSGASLAASLALFVLSQRPAIHPAASVVTTPAAATTSADTWESYIPEAVRLVHDSGGGGSGLVPADPVSLDDGLHDLSVDELEQLTLSLSPS